LVQPYTRSEAEFNADLRETLKVQGLGALHIRETDNPGAFDLLITLARPGWPPTTLWAELKVLDEELRTSQRTFNNERLKLSEMTLVMRLRGDRAVEIRSGSDFKSYKTIADFRKHKWADTLEKLLEEFYSEL
jgi:hypothetical protein